MRAVPKVVVDTNVILSGLLFSGPPRQILELAINGKVELHTSTDLLNELEGVLNLKFSRHRQAIADTLTEIQGLFHLTEPTHRLSVVKEDPDDNRVLECAVAAGADFIISGDKDLLRLGNFRKISIWKPAEFIQKYDRH